jgi:hypothetical protein
MFLFITMNHNIEIQQTIWKNWNYSGISYSGNSQYLNYKNSPYGNQDLCVNALVVTMY